MYWKIKNTGKYNNLSVPVTKETKRVDSNGKKITKLHLKNYNLLRTQDLWQTHYQILLIILLKEFKELDADIDMIMQHVWN